MLLVNITHTKPLVLSGGILTVDTARISSYGDPTDRDNERGKRDTEQSYVTRERAADVYDYEE